MDVEEFGSRAAAATGTEPVGIHRFGDSAELMDELLQLVLHGPKRATAFAAADMERDGATTPAVGQHWILADAAGSPQALARTEEVRVGPLYTVDAAFAWEAGWRDRTRSAWLAAHESYLRRQEFTDLEAEPLAFVRFRLVWPEPDTPRWWLPGVREVRGHEPLPDGPRPDLPALACFDGDTVTGVLRFEPLPEDLRLVSVRAERPPDDARLRDAFALRRQADRGAS